MPWKKEDVDEHKKGLSPDEKDKWVKIANSALEECLKEGKLDASECEAKAIRIANGQVGMTERYFIHLDADKFFTETREVEGKILRKTLFLYTGHFKHPVSGEIKITKEGLRHGLNNWKNGIGVKYIDDSVPVLHCNYDHPNSYSTNPEENKNSGLIYDFTLEGNKLFAWVLWTPKAEEYIRNKEYLWISPEFAKDWKDEEGESHGFTCLGMALTNYPFLKKEQFAVKLSDGKFAQMSEQELYLEVNQMTEKEYRKLLGIDDKADIQESIIALTESAKLVTDARKLFEMKDDDDFIKTLSKHKEEEEKAVTSFAELQATVGDIEKSAEGKMFVDKAEYTTLVEDAAKGVRALERIQFMEAEKKVDTEIGSGKTRIAPKQREWAINYCLSDPEGFEKYLENAPVVVNTEVKGSGGDNPVFSDDPRIVFHNAVLAKVEESGNKLDYSEASELVKAEKPELFKAWRELK